MENVKLKKVSKYGAIFNVFNETKKQSGFLICMFVGDSFEWHTAGVIPENILKNRSELGAEAKSIANQNSKETALPI